MADNGDDKRGPKRFKRDDNVDPTNPDPSIVVHVRNLSNKATEADLLEALSHFGTISYATVMPNKRMALVEFEDITCAKSCVTYAQTNQIYVAGQPALFNYSTSKMIQRIGLESEKPNHVLILTVYNAQYPISVDIIHTICKPHGEVYRIALIRKSLVQALVEFDSIDSARKAKYALNGADIYSGCCTLKVEFAKADHVKISRNDQDQWDFTASADEQANPNGGSSKEQRRSLLGPADMPSSGHHGGMGHHDSYGGPGGYMEGGFGGGYGGGYGGGGGGRGGYGPPSNQMDRMGGGGYGRGPPDGPPMHQRGLGGYAGGPPEGFFGNSCVVMVYGIDQEKMNCDKLFNLLCLYGNVLRIKFMKSKPDTAMVQMGDPQQVQCAIDNLHNTFLFDQKLALRPSKQATLHDIREPFDLPDGTASFKDYIDSRNQRFASPESAARNRVIRPTNVLHWFNAPANMTEEHLRKILVEKGSAEPESVSIFKGRSERSSSGTIEFKDAAEATECLVLCNHIPVDSPIGKIPYIVKFAYATHRDREFR